MWNKTTDLSKVKYINRRKSMTKSQKNKILKHLDKIKDKIKNGEKSHFTIEENDVYYTVDGIEGYNFPLETLKEITSELPESKDSHTISKTFNDVWSYGKPVRVNVKDFLIELKKHYKELSDNIGKSNADKSVYIINIRGTNHIYNLKRLINVLEFFGNDTKMYVSDNARSVMMFISDVGGMVLMPAICKDKVMKVNLTLD